jgi:hypothetical protein
MQNRPGEACMRNRAGLRIAQLAAILRGMARGEPTKTIAHGVRRQNHQKAEK